MCKVICGLVIALLLASIAKGQVSDLASIDELTQSETLQAKVDRLEAENKRLRAITDRVIVMESLPNCVPCAAFERTQAVELIRDGYLFGVRKLDAPIVGLRYPRWLVGGDEEAIENLPLDQFRGKFESVMKRRRGKP